MGTITKRADQLQPGDIVHLVRPSLGPEPVRFFVTGTRQEVALVVMEHDRSVETLKRDSAEVRVEVRDLTPAQGHAEELLALLRQAVASDEHTNAAPTPAWARRSRELFDEIDPPQPPTLAEALALLAEARNNAEPFADGRGAQVDRMVGRARRAGVLK